MAGLVPAIRDLCSAGNQGVDARVKPGHDGFTYGHAEHYWFALAESSIALKASSSCGEMATLSRSPVGSRLMNHFS
jgi:hypothetical protein